MYISQTTKLKFGVYMEDTKYGYLIEIDPVVIEMQQVENGNLMVPVNNTCARHMSFLVTDT